MVVSVFILQAAVKFIWNGIKEMIDAGAPKETCDQIKSIVMANDAVRQVHRIRTRYISTSLQVDLHIVVDGAISVFEGHEIAEAVKRMLIEEGPDIVDVIVHTEPLEYALPEEEC